MAASQREFLFVTVNDYQDFKETAKRRTVRKTAMADYLKKAEADPTSTDRRVIGKRRAANRLRSCSTRPDGRQIAPCPGSPGRPQLQDRMDSVVTIVEDDGSSPAFGQPVSHSATPDPQNLTPRSLSHPTNSTPSVAYTGCSNVFLEEVPDLSIEMERYLEAYKGILGDIPAQIDPEWLRNTCARFFRTQGIETIWMPLLYPNPLAYLSRLCVTAPYTDIMSTQVAPDPTVPGSDVRLTLEIFDVVPRMINDYMNDPVERCSDSCLVAVIHLFLGQLSSPYIAMSTSHQVALKQMVEDRGGLDKIGGNGAIAMLVVETSMEANILRNKPTDSMYLQWMQAFLQMPSQLKEFTPEGPLYTSSSSMRTVASSPHCCIETLELAQLLRRLNDNVLELARLDNAEKFAGLDESISILQHKKLLQESVRNAILKVHQLPARRPSPSSTLPDYIYEALRLAALLFVHAVWHRKPLHAPIFCSTCNCCVTPEMIFDIVRLTPITDLWDHMAGVLYWVLIVAAAACHKGDDDNDTAAIISDDMAAEMQAAAMNSRRRGSSAAPTFSSAKPPVRRTPQTLRQTLPAPSTPLVDPADLEGLYTPKVIAMEQRVLVASKMLFDQYAQRKKDDDAEPDRDHEMLGGGGNWGGDPADIDMELLDFELPATPDSSDLPNLEGFSFDAPAETRRKKKEDGSGGGVRAEQDVVLQRRAHEEYVRRYLTANALRVSILLRFDHPFAIASSISNMERVVSWLRRS